MSTAIDAPPAVVETHDDICPLGPVDPASIPDAEHEKGAYTVLSYSLSFRLDRQHCVLITLLCKFMFIVAAPWVVRKLVGVSDPPPIGPSRIAKVLTEECCLCLPPLSHGTTALSINIMRGVRCVRSR